MVLTVELSEQEHEILRTISSERGKNQSEVLREAIQSYFIIFQQEQAAVEDYDSLTDSELTTIAEMNFLMLDEAEEEYAHA